MIAKFIDLDDIGCSIEFMPNYETGGMYIITYTEGFPESTVSIDNNSLKELVKYLNIKVKELNEYE